MGWFKNLFSKRFSESTEYHPEFGLPPIIETVPMPEVKPTKPEKDISEPVLAIVKAMKQRPSTFKMVDKEQNLGEHYNKTKYTFKDIKTNQDLIVEHELYYYGSFKGDYTYSWSWLTTDEGELLRKEFLEINKAKLKRKSNIQRAAMKAIYQ